MSESHGKWMRPAGPCRPPRVIMTVVEEPWIEPNWTGTGTQGLRLRRLHVGIAKSYRGKWGDVGYFRFEDADAFWLWLEEEAVMGRLIRVFCPNAIHTLTLAGWWQRLDDRGCEFDGKGTKWPEHLAKPPSLLRTASAIGDKNSTTQSTLNQSYRIRQIMDGATAQIIRYRVAGRSFLWTSWPQYISADEEQVAAALHYAHFQTCALDGSLPERRRTPAERAMMWCRMMVKVIKWWVREDGGPFGASIAACAMSYLRRRIVPKTILQHEIAPALNLENAAIFGGRRQVWYVGNIGSPAVWGKHYKGRPTRSPHGELPGPMLHHDIRSMYPWLLATRDFPVKFLLMRRSPSVAGVERTLESHGVIATVDLHTHAPDYPQRTKAGVRWPVGHFTTSLAGPELSRAIKAGCVKTVHTAAVYQLGRPFAVAADALLALRDHYRAEEVDAWELFCKNLANALSGKLAQRDYVWTPRPGMMAKQRWGSWPVTPLGSTERRYFRALAGLVWERTESEDRPRPLGGAYAYLTSYGRCEMNDLIDRCPAKSVLACDTDGLWTTSAALDVLYPAGLVQTAAAGQLRVTAESPCGRFFGPQHYWRGSNWVLSGSKVPEIKPDSDRANVRERGVNLFESKSAPPPIVWEKVIERDVGRIDAHGVIGEDGWIIPHYVGLDGDHSTRQRVADPFRWTSRGRRGPSEFD